MQRPQVSLQPPQDVIARRTGRLVATVHELHKAGYQRIRISPGLSPSGMHWRCPVTWAGNVQRDGFSVISASTAGGLFVPYSSADPGYFGWPGAEALSARLLAVRFLDAFPALAQAGLGRDWAYAGWLTEVLGVVERGDTRAYPVFYADYPLDPGAGPVPPPPPPP